MSFYTTVMFKRFGLLYIPQRWPGYLMTLAAGLYLTVAFIKIDTHSHSASDTLINFFFQVLLTGACYNIVAFFFTQKGYYWHKASEIKIRYSVPQLTVIAGNILFILWGLVNGINEGFAGTLVQKVSYVGLTTLLAANSVLHLYARRVH